MNHSPDKSPGSQDSWHGETLQARLVSYISFTNRFIDFSDCLGTTSIRSEENF